MAGVTVTLMRALGIASRPVTCYNMASCSGAALARYFTSEGDFVHGITSDVVLVGSLPPVATHFNADCSNRVYRVCIEARMRRDDLPPGEHIGPCPIIRHLVLRKTPLCCIYCCKIQQVQFILKLIHFGIINPLNGLQ